MDERMIDSPLGKRAADDGGSPVGVVRMDAGRSYAGIGGLLQEYINNSNSEAWEKIRAKIDYTYENLDLALAPLERETRFIREIELRIAKGQKLLFKPNLVAIQNIDPQTHGPDRGSTTCTEWPFVAALMRWFHDRAGVLYRRMALGEAGTSMPTISSLYSMLNPEGKTVTVEAAVEGKAGGFYGGWGFYFVRKYLKESLPPNSGEDPMKGYEESLAGTYIPPGKVSDQLMVYDLNRVHDDPPRGRDISVPEGVNFQSITLHKAVVGGAPEDPGDLEAYPGCILVNVPKLKVHSLTLITSAIKNLGIGLYPMQAARKGRFQWDYSFPHTPLPGLKGRIPHQVWVPEMNLETGMPARDKEGKYRVRKTGGITATMMDVLKAATSQDIFMIHVVDALEAINYDHQGLTPGKKEPEGLVFAGLDPVATDLLCGRYMFSNVPLKEAEEIDLDDGTGARFPQRVPVPGIDGRHIVTRSGYDCPLSRDMTLAAAEECGFGQRRYHVAGRDTLTDSPLVSLHGHLGTVRDGVFSDLITKALYFNVFKWPWDMQETVFHYLEAVDQLAGSSLKRDFLRAFDDDGDGVVTYEEFGRTGFMGVLLHLASRSIVKGATERLGYLKGPFLSIATRMRYRDPHWNSQGLDLVKEYLYGHICLTAYRMSMTEMENPDPFLPGLTWGKGKWPSFQLAWHCFLGMSLYGSQFPHKAGLPGLYGIAFRYADQTQNDGRYTGGLRNQPNPNALNQYLSEVGNGSSRLLDFTLYVPSGYEKLNGSALPNVEATSDPGKILTASFCGGTEVWAE